MPLTEAGTSSKPEAELCKLGRALLERTGVDAHPHIGNANVRSTGIAPNACRNLRRENRSRVLVRLLDIDQCGCSGFFAAASRCSVISCSASGLRPVRA